jgi:hypothetical protein
LAGCKTDQERLIGSNIKTQMVEKLRNKNLVENCEIKHYRDLNFVDTIFINMWYSGRFRLGLLNNQNVSTEYRTRDFGTFYIFAPYNNSTYSDAIEHSRVGK